MSQSRGKAVAGSSELYAVTLVVAACSLLYELLIAQTLSLLAGNTVVWYSLTVGVYLGALGLAATFWQPAQGRSTWSSLFTIELLLSVFGGASVLLIHLAHSLHLYGAPSSSGGIPFLFFGVSIGMTVAVGLLSGVELPLLMRLGGELAGDGSLTNRVLGWDYFGALLAGLVFPMVLVPRLSLPAIGFLIAGVNLLVGLYILQRHVPRDGWRVERLAAAGALAVALALGASQTDTLEQYFLKRYYFHIEAADEAASRFSVLPDVPDVQRAFSPYQKIDLVHDPAGFPTDVLMPAYSDKWRDYPDFPENRFLFLNGDFQVSSTHEESYHEWFAHVPIVLRGEAPERVLVMGGGDGLLVRELVKYPEIRSIRHVDLDPTLIHLARTDPVLSTMNRGALEDPRVEAVFADAYQYLRRSDERWDAIYLDFPYAKDYNVAKLYSREIFHFVREHLAEDGYAVLDAPGANFYDEPGEDGYLRVVPEGEWDIYRNTLRAAGFQEILPYRSALEPDNPEAYALLDQWEGAPDFLNPFTGAVLEERKQEWMTQMVSLHLRGFREIFLSVWKGEAPSWTFHDPGVELSILNERRFSLSFPAPFDPSSQINRDLINSILRPTLPTKDVWSVRRPWN